MASFDFKNALKTGIKQKQVKKGLLREAVEKKAAIAKRVAGMGKLAPHGVETAMRSTRTIGGADAWTDGADRAFVEKWAKLDPSAAGYKSEAENPELETEMKVSPTAAAHVIMREIGASKWISEGEIEAVALGILYYSKKGQLGQLEQAFKKEAGIKRRMWPYNQLSVGANYKASDEDAKKSVESAIRRQQSNPKKKPAWYRKGLQGPADQQWLASNGFRKCQTAGSCVGAFILRYSALSGDEDRLRSIALTLLNDTNYNQETHWKISEEEHKTGKAAQELAVEKAGGKMAAGWQQKLKPSVIQDAAKLGKIKSVKFMPAKAAPAAAPKKAVQEQRWLADVEKFGKAAAASARVEVTFEKGTKVYPWFGTADEASAWFSQLKPEIEKAKEAAAAEQAAAPAAKEVAGMAVVTQKQPIAGNYVAARKLLKVTIMPVEKSVWWRTAPAISELSPNGKKHLAGQEKGSHINLAFSKLVKAWKNPIEKLDQDVLTRLYTGAWDLSKLRDPQGAANAMIETLKKSGRKIWLSSLKEAIKVATPIKGGGFRDIFKGTAFGDPAGKDDWTKIPVEESNLLEFEKTLQGLKHENLYKRLMPHRKTINEQTGIDWGEIKQAASTGGNRTNLSPQQMTQMIKAYESAREAGAANASGGFSSFLQNMLGSAVVGRIMSSSAGSTAAAASPGLWASVASGLGTAAVATAKGTVAALGGNVSTILGGSVAGSTVGAGGGLAVVGAGVAVAAAIGAAAGYGINHFFLSAGTEEDRQDRLKMAMGNPALADAAMEVYCKGTGMLCGDDAPDGWQVDCKNEMGGYAMDAPGGMGLRGGYTDPWGTKDLEQKAGSFSKQDVQDSLIFLGVLFDADQKAGRMKEVSIKKGEEGYIEGKEVVRLQLAEGSLLAKWEGCYKTNFNPYAQKALSGKLRKSYESIQYAFGLPIIKLGEAEKATQAAAAKASGPDPKRVKKVQEALVEFFGESLGIKMGKEFGTGHYGPVTQAAMKEFKSMFGDDPKFPTGEKAIKKLPDFIKSKAFEKELMAADEAEPLTSLERFAESKLSLHQKRLLEMNNRLMKF